MTRQQPRLWKGRLALLALGAAVALAAPTPAIAQQTSPSSGQSWTGSISSGFKNGVDKLGNMVSPKPAPKTADPKEDPVSLQNNGKPGPELNVAVARLFLERGRPAEAEEQYKLALTTKPDYLPALLGYAQLQDQVDRPGDALKLYQRAASVYPLQASVHNNMGLFFARRGQPGEAIAAMTRATRLDPKNQRYRNNLAMVLVEQDRPREALVQLREVYPEAVAYYNLGYLLNKKGQTQAALQHFVLALRADPSMVPAEHWVEYLHRTTAQARLPQHPMANGVRIADDPYQRSRPAQYGQRDRGSPAVGLPPGAQELPRRLPPPGPSDATSDGPSLPGISYDRSTPPEAPMPPPRSSGVRSPSAN
ncbi:MAG: tetratricopeptide repeat protein [Planctomycetaceae bacterium]|nr:tetratricopeptide repeat protein [Planctomycetaceae bacterium]